LASTGDEGRATCEKLRGVGRDFDPEISDMGEPGISKDMSSSSEFIGRGGKPAELKHLSRRRRRNQNEISSVAASERERA
jgi:hypothetical protein